MGRKPDVITQRVRHPKSMEPKRWLNFVQLRSFERGWSDLKMDDDDLRALETFIMVDPKRPPVVPGSGGLRKIRFGRADIGKSGGLRIAYVYLEEFGIVLLLVVYAKNEMDDLSPKRVKQYKALIQEITRHLECRDD